MLFYVCIEWAWFDTDTESDTDVHEPPTTAQRHLLISQTWLHCLGLRPFSIICLFAVAFALII